MDVKMLGAFKNIGIECCKTLALNVKKKVAI